MSAPRYDSGQIIFIGDAVQWDGGRGVVLSLINGSVEIRSQDGVVHLRATTITFVEHSYDSLDTRPFPVDIGLDREGLDYLNTLNIGYGSIVDWSMVARQDSAVFHILAEVFNMWKRWWLDVGVLFASPGINQDYWLQRDVKDYIDILKEHLYATDQEDLSLDEALESYITWEQSRRPRYTYPPRARQLPDEETMRYETMHRRHAQLRDDIESAVEETVPNLLEARAQYEKPSESTCAICMSGFYDTSTEKNIPIRLLKCGHVFHMKCIDRYLGTRTDQPCPFCRKSFNRQDLVEAPRAYKQPGGNFWLRTRTSLKF